MKTIKIDMSMDDCLLKAGQMILMETLGGNLWEPGSAKYNFTVLVEADGETGIILGMRVKGEINCGQVIHRTSNANVIVGDSIYQLVNWPSGKWCIYEQYRKGTDCRQAYSEDFNTLDEACDRLDQIADELEFCGAAGAQPRREGGNA